MPELPEVETMVRDLAPRLQGRMVSRIEALFAGSVVWPDLVQFTKRLVGQEIVALDRRGKFAIVRLASGDALIVHRGMTGSLLLRRPDEPLERHVRVVFHLDDALQLRFDDQRKFGKIYLLDATGSERPLPWAGMGPEPFDEAFTPVSLGRALRSRKALIKPLLLNQTMVAGLGNIYVDEALHLALVHPERRANTLTRPEVERIFSAIRSVLLSAVEGRGTTFSSYVDIEGRAGSFQGSLRVFRRAGQACLHCGATIQRLVVGGRGTHICPSCQRL